MQETTVRFDPAAYKSTTRAQWEAAAAAWHAWSPFLERWLGDATEEMLDAAGVSPGAHVLDVAAGAGGQTLTAAKRVGERGRVVATDISPAILAYAEASRIAAGFDNIEIREMDGEALTFPDGTFDAAISRVGLIYFPNQQTALQGLLRVLKPRAKLAAIVYSTPASNEFFSIPVGIIRRRANLPQPAPGQPGPFTLGSDGVLEKAFSQAGFTDVAVRRCRADVRLPNAAECARFERESFGALHQMMASLSEPERAATWAEIEAELEQFEGPSGFVGPCELLVGVGSKP